MGYTTEFDGEFKLDRPLTLLHMNYLEKFAGTRRMKRDSYLAGKLPDPVRESVGLNVGVEGCYFVGGGQDYGQEHDASVIDYNYPPKGQPGLWNHWIPATAYESTEPGTAIIWNGGEKFYNYIEWIKYLIQHFLKPWGYSLSGKMKWQGEDRGDLGIIDVFDNNVMIFPGKIIYPGAPVEE